MRGQLLWSVLANLRASPGNPPLNDTQGCEGASQNNSRTTVLGSRPFHLSQCRSILAERLQAHRQLLGGLVVLTLRVKEHDWAAFGIR